MTTNIDLDALQALAEKATQGEWKAYGSCVRIGRDPRAIVTAGIYRDMETATKDAEFIAACSPAAILSLIARIRDLERRAGASAETTRLDFMIEKEATVVRDPHDGSYRVYVENTERDYYEPVTHPHTEPREAIDAAISAGRAGGKEGAV